MNNTKSNIYSSNHWADFWHYKRGINIFPLDNDKATYEKWSKYQKRLFQMNFMKNGKEQVDMQKA